jgi:hypothetical protein
VPSINSGINIGSKDLTPEIVVVPPYQPCTHFTPVSILVGHIPASHQSQNQSWIGKPNIARPDWYESLTNMHTTRLVWEFPKVLTQYQDQAGMRISKGTHSIPGPGWYENFQRYSLNTRTRLVCSKLDTYQTNQSQRHVGESIFLEGVRVTWLLQGTQSLPPKLKAPHQAQWDPQKENATSRVRTPKLK